MTEIRPRLTAQERIICEALGADHIERDGNGWNVTLFKTTLLDGNPLREWRATVQGALFPSVWSGDSDRVDRDELVIENI